MEVSSPEIPTRSRQSCVLQALDIRKSFGAVVALSGVDLELRRGEIMGLVGDNGAGKSTLVKILAGSVFPDAGSVIVNDQEVAFRSPADALANGIETVYQDLSLIEPLSAYGNIFLGREPLRRGTVSRLLRLLDSKSMRQKARDVLADLGARIPSIDSPVHDLSGGQRQSLAIARALLFGRQIVVLDEPTAALGVRETEHVLEMIRRLNDTGISIVVVSHNIEQLLTYADRVTVIRLGRTVGLRSVSRSSPAEIVSLITGATGADPSPNGSLQGSKEQE
ncbi:MAG: ATP-binding cassette domain-containing protein [Streptosporangiaceae bacterium]